MTFTPWQGRDQGMRYVTTRWGLFWGLQQAPFSRTEKLGQSGKAKNCSSSNVYLKLSTKIKPLLLFYNLVLDFF